MKKFSIIALILLATLTATAQINKVSLQASGLTCSMCSKSVQNALEKLDFVSDVKVDLKDQRYNLTFRNNASIDIDRIAKAVEDAGFSVAQLQVTAVTERNTLQKDQHIVIGNQTFHFLNGEGKTLPAEGTFTIVDKSFTSAKNFKKFSALSTMECVKTGHSEACCSKDTGSSTRIYHAII